MWEPDSARANLTRVARETLAPIQESNAEAQLRPSIYTLAQCNWLIIHPQEIIRRSGSIFL